MKLLAKECARLVGKDKFVAAFNYLQQLDSTRSISEADKQAQLRTILASDERMQHAPKIDQLVFMTKMYDERRT